MPIRISAVFVSLSALIERNEVVQVVDISIWLFVMWWLIGLIIGAGLVYVICYRRKDGVIHVTLGRDKEADQYLFEFNIPPEDIPTMDQVVFKVRIEGREPQNLQSV